MSNWSRAHDAWIARECEGLEVIPNGPDFVIFAGWEGRYQEEPQRVYKPVYCYSTDPAAAIRAAEAWQLKDVRKRSVELRWRGELKIVELMDYSDDAAQLRTFGNGGTVEAALAQALLRATGGPA